MRSEEHISNDVSEAARRIGEIISNRCLASDIASAIAEGLSSERVHLGADSNIWAVFESSFRAAIRDINDHPKGQLLRRLIQYGPPNPDEPETLISTGEGVLSDPECGECVNFIYSHMLNRFKGDLAELLAIKPCTEILHGHHGAFRLPRYTHLYFGDLIGERRRATNKSGLNVDSWIGFAKGADGLFVEFRGVDISILGVVEVKSMRRSVASVRKQIVQHVERMTGGLKLGADRWAPNQIDTDKFSSVMVCPAAWKFSRNWNWVKAGDSRAMVYKDSVQPLASTSIEEHAPGFWIVKLAWSVEALEQAAYEMTFWYMSQVGKAVFGENALPREWEGMSVEEGGRNSIKMMLYYVMLRYISKRQGQRATKLYNVYSFGYPVGVDTRDMLWPEDLERTLQ